MLPDNEADPELASKLKLKREKEREKERAKVEKEKEYEEGIDALFHLNNLKTKLHDTEPYNVQKVEHFALLQHMASTKLTRYKKHYCTLKDFVARYALKRNCNYFLFNKPH